MPAGHLTQKYIKKSKKQTWQEAKHSGWKAEWLKDEGNC